MLLSEAYKILNLQPGASLYEVQAAYRAIALKTHPDVSTSAESQEEFCRATDAVEKIRNNQLNRPSTFSVKENAYSENSEVRRRRAAILKQRLIKTTIVAPKTKNIFWLAIPLIAFVSWKAGDFFSVSKN